MAVISDPNGTSPAADRRDAARFVRLSGGFWTERTAAVAWILTAGLAAAVILRIGVDVGVNRWNRWFFDALERRDAMSASMAATAFVVLIAALAAVGVAIVRLRETLQVRWREWWTARLVDGWLSRQHFGHLVGSRGVIDNPEYRISDDVRMATEPLVDFAIGLFTAALSAVTFVGILWTVGGALTLGSGADAVTIPAFMVLGAIAYAAVVSCLIPIVGRKLAGAAEARNESEARLRAELIRLRENADSIALSAGHGHARARIASTYRRLVVDWLALVRQHGHVTWVMNSNTALVPVVPLLIAAPKYLQGALTLGEVMQLASAFVQVQMAIGWLVDNYWRLAEWQASARRVFELADALEGDGERGGIGFGPSPDGLVRLEGLCLTDPRGRVLVEQADLAVAQGERIQIGGDPGVGKSVFARALAGLWLWGSGTVAMPPGARLAFLPPWPFLPQGSLADAVLYPDDPSDLVGDDAVELALLRCGLAHLVPRLAEIERWDRVLSAGECYRLGLVRLVLQRPSVIVMDGFAGALDPPTQGLLADILDTDLAAATVIMVGPAGSLASLATRTLVLRPGRNGARLVETMEPMVASPVPVTVANLKAPRARALQP